MNPPTLKPLIVPGYENESPATSLRSIVRKSALLDLTISLTSFPVLAGLTHHFFRAYAPLFPAFLRVSYGN